jgi:hypothetical protein
MTICKMSEGQRDCVKYSFHNMKIAESKEIPQAHAHYNPAEKTVTIHHALAELIVNDRLNPEEIFRLEWYIVE